MFGRNKVREKEKRENERMVRKVLGKESPRKVFGFQCDPEIPAFLKLQADQLHVPEFAIAEHALQLGMLQIVAANNDPAERELLRLHLTEVHVGTRTIEKVDRYDKTAGDWLEAERMRRFSVDKAARQLVIKFMAFGHKADELEELIMFGYRCRVAIRRGWPMPPEIPNRRNDSRPAHDDKNQSVKEDKGGNNPDKPEEK
jgi:hypothetical protein